MIGSDIIDYIVQTQKIILTEFVAVGLNLEKVQCQFLILWGRRRSKI